MSSSNSIEDVEKASYGHKAPESNIQVLPADDSRDEDVMVDVHSGIHDGLKRVMQQRVRLCPLPPGLPSQPHAHQH